MENSHEIVIRPFSSTDHTELIALWRSAGLTIKPSDSLPALEKLCAIGSNRVFIAESTGEAQSKRIVGAIVAAFDGRRAWLYHLAVLPVAQRSGIATRLVRATETHFRAIGATKVNLLVEPGNASAHQFYEALGFSQVPLTFFTKQL